MKSNLEKEFQEAYTLASNLKKKLPPDVMLKLYAYYKQAKEGDHFSYNTDTKGLRNAFKFNAWIQLRGMAPNKAKEEYIKLVKSIIN